MNSRRTPTPSATTRAWATLSPSLPAIRPRPVGRIGRRERLGGVLSFYERRGSPRFPGRPLRSRRRHRPHRVRCSPRPLPAGGAVAFRLVQALAYRPAGLGPCRAGFAPAGRRFRISRTHRPLLADQQSLVATRHRYSRAAESCRIRFSSRQVNGSLRVGSSMGSSDPIVSRTAEGLSVSSLRWSSSGSDVVAVPLGTAPRACDRGN
jgi:hypothetical protein